MTVAHLPVISAARAGIRQRSATATTNRILVAFIIRSPFSELVFAAMWYIHITIRYDSATGKGDQDAKGAIAGCKTLCAAQAFQYDCFAAAWKRRDRNAAVLDGALSFPAEWRRRDGRDACGKALFCARGRADRHRSG